MEVKDIDPIVEKLNQAEQRFGLWGAVLLIVLVVIMFVLWRFLVRKTELLAEEVSEKSLKKIQLHLDKELVRFQTKHQKQIDAIQEVFQHFQRMTGTIRFLMKGEKFTKPLHPREEIALLIKSRHQFKKIYGQNRLLFSEHLCGMIDSLIPTIDNFIEEYQGGFFPEPTEEEMEFNEEENNGLYIAAMWSMDAFTETIPQLEQISREIEIEFRKIYGTNE